ncbi:hypothetical protein [Paenibacillus sp. 2TAB19]|uniref:hypothetical protein n=1 Tax=Paenibacillus sp. 2TAB19 TaxID=3233003 RepID=UPI003F94AE6E
MKRIEIKEIGIKSAFKTTIYFSIIPLALMMVIGFIVIIIGILIGNTGAIAMGFPYFITPIFMVGIYGALSMLVSLVYNKLSNKFGGLELVITESDDPRRGTMNEYNGVNRMGGDPSDRT